VLTQAADMAGWEPGSAATAPGTESGWPGTAGRVINPDGVTNQVEGGAVQSASWTLREQVRFDRYRITSAGWDSYPILRFTDTPQVMVRVIDAPGEAEVGAGEVAQGPVAGAIGNAVADAVGVRVRDLPLTRENVTRAIEEN
jgi:nicotinate dehydrogenase subunit B